MYIDFSLLNSRIRRSRLGVGEYSLPGSEYSETNITLKRTDGFYYKNVINNGRNIILTHVRVYF